MKAITVYSLESYRTCLISQTWVFFHLSGYRAFWSTDTGSNEWKGGIILKSWLVVLIVRFRWPSLNGNLVPDRQLILVSKLMATRYIVTLNHVFSVRRTQLTTFGFFLQIAYKNQIRATVRFKNFRVDFDLGVKTWGFNFGYCFQRFSYFPATFSHLS